VNACVCVCMFACLHVRLLPERCQDVVYCLSRARRVGSMVAARQSIRG
jgi:hypothetical protein